MAEDVMGNFVFTILDENNTLYFVKGNNPLYLIYFERFGLYVYASTKSIMDNALKAIGMQYEKPTIIKVCESDIVSISSDGEIDSSRFNPYDYSFFSADTRRTRYSYEWYNWEDDNEYTDEEELILDMCNCYGIDEDDVLLLLDYGYTAMEIEDMFMDTDLLQSSIHEVKQNSFYNDFV